MTIPPFYEPLMLEMTLETYAGIAIDGGIWLAGELLAQTAPAENSTTKKDDFVPDPRNIHRPRHLETVLPALCRTDEELRHRIFISGFLMMPDNGAQETFRQLLVTHNEMLYEAMRQEWTRRLRKRSDAAERQDGALGIANELLHKLLPPR
jgi:hypothetical protein